MYWNFTHSNKLYEYEAETKEAIIERANEWWSDKCIDDGVKNGEVMRDVVTLVCMDNGEIISTEKHTVEYEHYHGDFKEHGVNN